MKWVLAFVMVVFLSGVTSAHVDAQVTHIKIEDQIDPSPIAKQYTQFGNWTVLHSSGSYTCVPGTTNKYTISGTPTLVASDASPDYIQFHNATITANNPAVCGHIYFWTKVFPGPSGTVDFDLSIGVQLKRGNTGASGSWAHFSGWLQHPATTQGEADGTSGAWEHVGSLGGPPASLPALDKHATAASYSWPPPPYAMDESPDLSGIINPRIMKGEIWFFLANNGDKLILPSGSGVNVTTAAGGGGGGAGQVFDAVIDTVADRTTELERAREEFIKRFQRIETYLKLPYPIPGPDPGPEGLEGLEELKK